MSDDVKWVPVAEYGATYEAEFAAGFLRDAEIPVLVRGTETGIFGPGFAGATVRGATVLVPSAFVERAREILDREEGTGEEENGEAEGAP